MTERNATHRGIPRTNVIVSGILALVWVGFQLYTAAFGFLPALSQCALHVGFAIALALLFLPAKRPRTQEEKVDAENAIEQGEEDLSKKRLAYPLDVVLAVLAMAASVYIYLNYERLVTRIPFLDPVETLDLVAAVVLIVTLLESCRRSMGWILPILAGIFLVYQFVGQYLPGLWGHSGIEIENLLEYQVLGVQGIYGVPIQTVGNYVFYFVVLAGFMNAAGTGALFNDLAMKLTGRYRGGPAKTAVASSAAMGMLSGSAVGNVATTGVFTIPLMIRAGFKAKFAAAVEAVASTGGQIMPPIMGAAAFIMAEFLQRPYAEIVIAAIVPAVLYYLSIFLVVDFTAKRQGTVGLKRADLPSWKSILNRVHLLIPIIILIGMIAGEASLQRAALYSIAASLVVPFLWKSTWVHPKTFLTGAINGAKQATQVTLPAAAAGIIVGTVSYSGLGLKLSPIVIGLGGGILLLTLVLVALVCLVLGAGMPTTGAYITGAVLLAPALIELGVEPMPAHLFILYFCVLSMVTPPVALAAFAAASIASTPTMATGAHAFKLAIAGVLVPFAFVLQPSLIFGENADPVHTPLGLVMLIIGLVATASVVAKQLVTPNSRLHQSVLLVSAALLIYPEIISGIIGLVGVVAVVVLQRRTVSPKGPTGGPAAAEELALSGSGAASEAADGEPLQREASVGSRSRGEEK
ncbi:MAG: TRAP transporter permease [Actinomycetaceae bacterium]